MMNKLKSFFADVSYYWKFSGLLVLSMAIIPTLALIYIHQGVLAAGSITVFGLLAVLFIITLGWITETAMFLLVFDWISGKLGASNIKADWRLLWPVFVVGYSVIAIWVLVEMGIPNYRDEISFYAEEAQIEKQIKSGNLDAVRDLGFLYLEKSDPIPYPYNNQSIHKKGENILDKWFTGKLNNGTAKDYTDVMVRFAKTQFLQNKTLAKKWLVIASNYGNKSALVWLKGLAELNHRRNQRIFELLSSGLSNKQISALLESEQLGTPTPKQIKRMELRQKRIQEQKTKERENWLSHPIKSLGKYLGKIKREASDTITKTTTPIKKKWQEFQEGISEGESKSGN